MERPRIDVVEDDEVVGASVAALLSAYGFDAVCFESAEAFFEGGSRDAACVLMDVRLPGADGIEALRRMRAAGSRTPVIVVTGHGDVALAVSALRAGAADFIEKPYDDADLLARIETARAAAKAPPVDPALADCFAALTPREDEVMREVVAGYSNKVIAHRLGLSPKTIEVHRARVMDKTGADSLSQLVRMALKSGIDPDRGG